MGIIQFYLSEIADMKATTIIFLPLFLIITCSVVFAMPISYSFLIAIIFTAVGFLSEFMIASILQVAGLTTYIRIRGSLMLMSTIQLGVTVFLLSLTYFFYKRKFGFMFVESSMYGRKVLKPINILFGILLVLVVCAIEVSRLSIYTATHSIVHPIIFFTISALLVTILLVAWRKNKKSIDKKYTNTIGVGKK
ncbi:hypothetical protein DVH26_16930 [Paenibacillus sp. H1-7]|nr:hypothetical protein DVH26_16930 [Paenibacillus sp. H1-7]